MSHRHNRGKLVRIIHGKQDSILGYDPEDEADKSGACSRAHSARDTPQSRPLPVQETKKPIERGVRFALDKNYEVNDKQERRGKY